MCERYVVLVTHSCGHKEAMPSKVMKLLSASALPCYHGNRAQLDPGIFSMDSFLNSLNKKGIMICVACHLLGVMFGIVQNSIGKRICNGVTRLNMQCESEIMITMMPRTLEEFSFFFELKVKIEK